MPNTDHNSNSRKGWRGNSEGHAKAGQAGGLKTASTKGQAFYSQIGKKGGRMSSGNFKNDPERAREAGRKGGSSRGKLRT